MGKRQHQKDKMYITCTEYTNFYGGKKTAVASGIFEETVFWAMVVLSATEALLVGKPPDQQALLAHIQNICLPFLSCRQFFIPQANFRRLPFDHCSLSLQPFEYPVCTPDGMVFDLLCIIPWIKKFGTHPTTGEKLDVKSLIKLNYHKNSEGKYHCPVMYSVFTNNSHILAIKSSGNVYSHEAVEQLNIKTKNFKDLLNDEPFTRQDIITLQDPYNVDKFNVSNFFHVKRGLKVPDPDEEKAKSDPSYYLKSTSLELRETLTELYRDYKGDEMLASIMKEPGKKKVDKINAAHYSTGKVSASFTSTAMMPETKHEAAAIDDDQLRYRYVKKKGYVRLHTSKGDLNLELHCEMTSRTCENFIKLCKKGYYDGTKFHRSIRNFMIQGGDPSGTGTGGESYWGKPFKDEFKPNLSHAGRGILSMANSGPNTNKSQFFITFRSCVYLDKKHTVFGRVVGGFDTLTAMENVESDVKTDLPKEEIRIESTSVFVDPFEEADLLIAAEREKSKKEEEEERDKAKGAEPKGSTSAAPKTYRQGVGKYINMGAKKRGAEDQDGIPSTSSGKKTKGITGFGDFSSW
ncbi:RING-type E3 ubiquitin-protein ligase PPIL2 isoform X2 [Narcine bancroftii]|uniref:RING-type E3 ubiquitin-protein ligase PPIL2 isoform X2 n=1 Tax=Narcine bancroftii TaxID=1343680 RepID=UPI00383155D6